MSATLKVISRNSKLAILQTQEFFGEFPELTYTLITLPSFGDKRKDISLLENPPADIFTRELDAQILSGEADIAIHSAKDLPYPLPEGLELIALTQAFDETDSLVSKQNKKLNELSPGSKVGTSSPVRKQELLALRPDLEVVSIRGTIEERIAQVEDGTVDALIVASCALKRLNLFHRAAEVLPFRTHPLQGSLAVVAKTGRTDLQQLFANADIRREYGKVTLVGFGPGNPELLTIVGEKALQQADVVYYDDLTDHQFLKPYKAAQIYVGKRKDKHSHAQEDIQRLLLDAARAGKSVVRLKGGDPMVFAHGGEEVIYLHSNYVQTEVIPGISTGLAVASLTSIPLTHRGISSSVAFISGHAADVQLPDTDTVVIYMGGANIRPIAENAISRGRKPGTEVMLVYNVSRSDQQIFFSTLAELSREERAYPTPLIIVVGDVVSLRNYLTPQKRSKMLVTGTHREQFDKLGEVIHQPLIEIKRTSEEALKEKTTQLKNYDWLFFTSRYSVQFFFETLNGMGKDSRFLGNIRVASVGRVTSEALKTAGIMPDIQPEDESSEGLLRLIQEKQIEPGKVFIPRSNLGLKVLPEGLQQLGWQVETFAIYENKMPDNLQPIDLNEIDTIVFSSPSCVTNFLQLYGGFPEGKEYVFRGRETEKRFKDININPDLSGYKNLTGLMDITIT